MNFWGDITCLHLHTIMRLFVRTLVVRCKKKCASIIIYTYIYIYVYEFHVVVMLIMLPILHHAFHLHISYEVDVRKVMYI